MWPMHLIRCSSRLKATLYRHKELLISNTHGQFWSERLYLPVCILHGILLQKAHLKKNAPYFKSLPDT